MDNHIFIDKYMLIKKEMIKSFKENIYIDNGNTATISVKISRYNSYSRYHPYDDRETEFIISLFKQYDNANCTLCVIRESKYYSSNSREEYEGIVILTCTIPKHNLE